MANHKSALKRIRQNEIRRLRNKSTKTRIKHMTKDVRQAATENAAESASRSLDQVKSTIDKASKQGVIHRNTAARKISRLARMVNRIEA